MNTQIAHSDHLTEVLELQRYHHCSRIGCSPRQGFLTFQCDLAKLKILNSELGVIVSVDRNKVVGYNILMTTARAKHEPVYTGLLTTYEHLRKDVDPATVAVSAQYCVKASHRGGRVARSLFDKQRQILSEKGFSLSIGEIDSNNRISLACVTHMLRYALIGEYKAGDTKWIIAERDESA